MRLVLSWPALGCGPLLVGPRRLAGRQAVWIVHHCSPGSRNRALQQRVIGLTHPAIQSGAHLGSDMAQGRVMGKVTSLMRVKDQISSRHWKTHMKKKR